VILADIRQDAFGHAQLVPFAGDDRVLKARALGEEEDFLGLLLRLGEGTPHTPGTSKEAPAASSIHAV
jgi:hypothetical protein